MYPIFVVTESLFPNFISILSCSKYVRHLNLSGSLKKDKKKKTISLGYFQVKFLSLFNKCSSLLSGLQIVSLRTGKTLTDTIGKQRKPIPKIQLKIFLLKQNTF